MVRPIGRWVIAWMVLLTGGCQHGQKQVLPSVQVLGVTHVQQTPKGVRLEMVLGVENPNLVALPLVRSEYVVTVDGVGVFEFADRLNQTVPAGVQESGSPTGRQTVRLPVAFAWSGQGLAGVGYRVQGTLFYQSRTPFRAFVSEWIGGLAEVPFDGSGRIQ